MLSWEVTRVTTRKPDSGNADVGICISFIYNKNTILLALLGEFFVIIKGEKNANKKQKSSSIDWSGNL